MSAEYNPNLIVALTALSAALLVPSCWFSWKTVHNAHNTVFGQSLNRRNTRVLSVSPRARDASETPVSFKKSSPYFGNQHQSSAKWTMICTILSSVFFTISILINLIRRSVYYHRIADDSNDKDKGIDVRKKSKLLRGLLVLYFTLKFFGYKFLITACFQRLILTFKHSQYRLTKQDKWMGNLTIIGIFVLLFISLIVFQISDNIRIAVLISIPCLVAFPVMFGWITWRFMSTTHTLAKNMISMTQSNQIRENDEDTSNGELVVQRTNDLLDASLRLTVVTVFSLLSTIFTAIFGAVSFSVGSPTLLRIVIFLFPLDGFVHVFTLLCTFHESIQYYLFVFGFLHQYLLKKLTMRLTLNAQK